MILPAPALTTIFHVFNNDKIQELDALSDVASQKKIDLGSVGPSFFCGKRTSQFTVLSFARTMPRY